GAQAADQRVQLRPLQDLRHRRSLPDHYLGHARGRRRAGLQTPVIHGARRLDFPAPAAKALSMNSRTIWRLAALLTLIAIASCATGGYAPQTPQMPAARAALL